MATLRAKTWMELEYPRSGLRVKWTDGRTWYIGRVVSAVGYDMAGSATRLLVDCGGQGVHVDASIVQEVR